MIKQKKYDKLKQMYITQKHLSQINEGVDIKKLLSIIRPIIQSVATKVMQLVSDKQSQKQLRKLDKASLLAGMLAVIFDIKPEDFVKNAQTVRKYMPPTTTAKVQESINMVTQKKYDKLKAMLIAQRKKNRNIKRSLKESMGFKDDPKIMDDLDINYDQVPAQQIFSRPTDAQLKQFVGYMVEYLQEQAEEPVSDAWKKRFLAAVRKDFGVEKVVLPNPFVFDAEEVAQFLCGQDFGGMGDYSMTQVNDARWPSYAHYSAVITGTRNEQLNIEQQVGAWSEETGVDLWDL